MNINVDTDNDLHYLPAILSAYGLKIEDTLMESLGNGLINRTWKLTHPGNSYVLQQINKSVFHRPFDIAHNTRLIGDYLQQHSPGYVFARPIPSVDGEDMLCINNDYFRLLPYVAGSHTMDVVVTPNQAYNAAAQFGRFTRLLDGFEVNKLKMTIDHFHDLSFRYREFLAAIQNGNPHRVKAGQVLIAALLSHKGIVAEYEHLKAEPGFKRRVTHHDAKISNVLFDKNDNGICIIDLDTVMPGFFISDVGDMMRTYLSPVSGEVSDGSGPPVRIPFYKAIEMGYYDEMKEVLTPIEKNYFFFAGKFMIYMQAIRFLTDHLLNDCYYGTKYENHNYYRASHEMLLLKNYIDLEKDLTT